MERILHNIEDMERFAADVAAKLSGGDLLLLFGGLGAGKTTFTQYLAKHLNITERVTSPTFTIVSEYVAARESVRVLIHADLYRLEDRSEDLDIAVRDILERRSEVDRVTVIEWADRIKSDISDAIKLHFSQGSSRDERVVRLLGL